MYCPAAQSVALVQLLEAKEDKVPAGQAKQTVTFVLDCD